MEGLMQQCERVILEKLNGTKDDLLQQALQLVAQYPNAGQQSCRRPSFCSEAAAGLDNVANTNRTPCLEDIISFQTFLVSEKFLFL